MTNLFQKQDIVLNSGQASDFKIECDALAYMDLKCLCYLISKKLKFKRVVGVPTGGIRIQHELAQYCIDDESLPLLICDDVLTTGGSMNRLKSELESTESNIIGVVLFSRGKCPAWVESVLSLNF